MKDAKNEFNIFERTKTFFYIPPISHSTFNATVHIKLIYNIRATLMNVENIPKAASKRG